MMTTPSTRSASSSAASGSHATAAPPSWPWSVTVTIPGPPFGDAESIGDAKAGSKRRGYRSSTSADQSWRGPMPR
jgi:hypothetical protein